LGLALSKLYKEHGIRPVEDTNLLGMLVQVLLGAGIYSAIRRGLGSGGQFLWIRNLAQPNLPLTIGTGVLTFLAALLGPTAPAIVRRRHGRASPSHPSVCLETGGRGGSVLGGVDCRDRIAGIFAEQGQGCLTAI